MFKNVVIDIETEGLLAVCTTLHCLALLDVDTGEQRSYADQPGYTPLSKGLEIVRKAKTLIGHNILKFDIPALEKLYDFTYSGKIYDTLIAAKTAYPDLMPFDVSSALPKKLWGRHGLKAWGYRIGEFKGEYGEEENAWDKWTPEMHTYCEQDVAVTYKLYKFLLDENIPKEALKIEHELGKFLFAQEQGGFPFNKAEAEKLAAQLALEEAACLEELKGYFGKWVKRGTYVIPKSNRGKIGDKKSTLFRVAKGCSYCTMEIKEYTGGPDQTKQALKRLYNWEPLVIKKRKRLKGEMQAVLEEEGTDEATLSKLDFPCIPSLIRYNNVRKIRGMLENGVNAWLKLYNEETGCIHGQVNQNGTITHRATHQRPNISQVPSARRPYGKECRELFYVPEGWSIVGTDASGLELRMLAHYMAPYDKGAYGNIILNGDIHTENMKAAGLTSRNQAKTFIYGYLYGGGGAKLGSIVDPLADEKRRVIIGNRLKDKFLRSLPALKQVLEDTSTEAAEKNYVTSLDGRKTYVGSPHKALNCLLQSGGSIAVKKWITLVQDALIAEYGKPGWEGSWTPLSYSHDDFLLAVKDEHVEKIQKIILEKITEAGIMMKLNIRLDGESKVGKNWAETH